MTTVTEFNQLFEQFQRENKNPTKEIIKKKYYFPMDHLKIIYMAMLKSTDIQWSQFEQMLIKYVKYLDFCYYSWECFAYIVQILDKDKTNVYMFLNMMGLIKIHTEKKEDDKLLFYSNKRPQFKHNQQQLKSWVTIVWNGMKPFVISNAKIRREMLILLIEKILVNLNNPVVTADLLMESMDIPGPIAVLGLQGIFILVKDYNLECPNIYGKLYNFFTTQMFNYRYKTRLFYLADIFLRSTHLPELLVAAFVKRMARLCLIASPVDIKIMVAFIGNLIIRHPPLQVLIHNNSVEVDSDPYIFEEKDPLKSNALNSSLWELVSLKQHFLPQISESVNFLFKKMPQVEWDISELLDDSYENMIDEVCEREFQTVGLAHRRPVSYCEPEFSNNMMNDLWELYNK